MEAVKDYIFINYSRDDLPKVTPVVEAMRNSGYNVWYDANILPGEDWTDHIASRIANCAVCVAFHSQTSRDSPHCREEIHYALKHGKTVISVYLEDVTLKEGLDMQLARFQSVKYAESAALLETLRQNPDFERCGSEIPKKRNYAKRIDVTFQKIGKQFHSAWNKFLLNVLFPIEAFLLFFACFMLIGIYGGENPNWSWDENGILEIKSLPLSTAEMTDYSYSQDSDFLPPPWAKKTPLIQFVVIRKGVTHIGTSSFQNCSNMKFVVISEGVTSIGTEAFSGCTSLKEINFPDSLESLGYGAFSDCIGLDSVDFPSSITTISEYSFSGCTALKQVRFSESSSLFECNRGIGTSAFANCTALEEITIPHSICVIESNSFLGCSNLKTVHILSDHRKVQIVDDIPYAYGSSYKISTLYISSTAFESGTEVIFEPSGFKYIWDSDYEGGLFHEN